MGMRIAPHFGKKNESTMAARAMAMARGSGRVAMVRVVRREWKREGGRERKKRARIKRTLDRRESERWSAIPNERAQEREEWSARRERGTGKGEGRKGEDEREEENVEREEGEE